MRIYYLIAFLFLLSSPLLFAQDHIGTWHLTSIRLLDLQGAILQEYDISLIQKQVKVLSPTHFIHILLRIDTLDTTKTHLERFVTGHYRLEGKKYNEFYDYTLRPNDMSRVKSEDFSLSVENDQLYLYSPALDSIGEPIIWEEIYQRINYSWQDTAASIWKTITHSTEGLRTIIPLLPPPIATTMDCTTLQPVLSGIGLQHREMYVDNQHKRRNPVLVNSRK